MHHIRNIFLTLALVLGLASSAQAGTIASFDTQGCPETAPVWRIAYDLYWDNGAGLVYNRDEQLPGVLASTNEFAAKIGTLSECSVRVHVDVNENGLANAGGHEAPGPGYDMRMKRYPAPSADFGGQWLSTQSIIFPATPGDVGNGYSALMVHEFLHGAVFFYSPPNGYPYEDVHGACANPAYNDGNCNTNERWFADLMTGRIVENGVAKGIPKEFWAFKGTPIARAHPAPSLYSEITEGRLNVTTEENVSLVNVNITTLAGQAVKSFALYPKAGTASWRIKDVAYGKYLLCVVVPVSALYDTWSDCQEVTVEPVMKELLTVKRSGNFLIIKRDNALKNQKVRVKITEEVSSATSYSKVYRTYITVKLKASTTRVRLPNRKAKRSNRTAEISIKAFTKSGIRYPTYTLEKSIK